MKVLLINGSAKEKGCTYTALSEIADVLEQEGVDTEIANLGPDAIRDCIGCGQCNTKHPGCFFEGDCPRFQIGFWRMEFRSRQYSLDGRRVDVVMVRKEADR